MSNIVAVDISSHSALANSITAARAGTPASSGQSRPASLTTSPIAASDASGEISRGHHSTTPKTAQPAWISQNSSGGLWL